MSTDFYNDPIKPTFKISPQFDAQGNEIFKFKDFGNIKTQDPQQVKKIERALSWNDNQIQDQQTQDNQYRKRRGNFRGDKREGGRDYYRNNNDQSFVDGFKPSRQESYPENYQNRNADFNDRSGRMGNYRGRGRGRGRGQRDYQDRRNNNEFYSQDLSFDEQSFRRRDCDRPWNRFSKEKYNQNNFANHNEPSQLQSRNQVDFVFDQNIMNQKMKRIKIDPAKEKNILIVLDDSNFSHENDNQDWNAFSQNINAIQSVDVNQQNCFDYLISGINASNRSKHIEVFNGKLKIKNDLDEFQVKLITFDNNEKFVQSCPSFDSELINRKFKIYKKDLIELKKFICWVRKSELSSQSRMHFIGYVDSNDAMKINEIAEELKTTNKGLFQSYAPTLGNIMYFHVQQVIFIVLEQLKLTKQEATHLSKLVFVISITNRVHKYFPKLIHKLDN